MLNASVDYSRLAGHPRLKIIIENLLRVDHFKRWDANLVLTYAQHDFIVDIQRVWRGYKCRLEYRRKAHGLVMIQAAIKGYVTRSRYLRGKVNRKDRSALMIQSRFRAYV